MFYLLAVVVGGTCFVLASLLARSSERDEALKRVGYVDNATVRRGALRCAVLANDVHYAADAAPTWMLMPETDLAKTIPLGDDAFDRIFAVSGAAATLLAVWTPECRKEAIALASYAKLRVGAAGMKFEALTDLALLPRCEALAARLLGTPADLGTRFRTETTPRIRERIVAEYPPIREEARVDRDANVRFRAAYADQNHRTLRELLSEAWLRDENTAACIDALLDDPSCEEGVLKAYDRGVVHAAVRWLVRHGTAACLPRLIRDAIPEAKQIRERLFPDADGALSLDDDTTGAVSTD